MPMNFEEQQKVFEFAGSSENKEAIRHMLHEFCLAHHIYGRCYGADGRESVGFCGMPGGEDFITSFIPAETESSLVASFKDSGVEDVIVGVGSESFLLIRALAIRVNDGTQIGTWILYGIDKDTLPISLEIPDGIDITNGHDFEAAVRLLSVLTDTYFKEKFYAFSLENRLKETESIQTNLSKMLDRNETMTHILKLLESENDFSMVAEEIIGKAGKYLGLTDVALLQKNPDGETVDMLCEWTDGTRASLMHQFMRRPMIQVPFFTGKPYTISFDSIMPEDFRAFFNAYDITAGIFLPLTVGDDVGMYLCFMQLLTPRKWSVEEIRFLNDVKRVLQTILIKRVTKNSLASSYAVIDAILENAGCGICVNEEAQGLMLYSNETFGSMFSYMSDRMAFENMLMNMNSALEEPTREFHAEEADRYYSVSFAHIHWVDGRKVRMCTLYDITELKLYQRRIEDQVNHDDMTSLFNRHRFGLDFNESIRDAVRSGGDQGTFLYIDLDDFKEINDGLGHHVGDALLEAVARSLSAIVKDNGSCYRIGGDEFAILVPYYKQKEVDDIIEIIQKRFSQPWQLGESDYYCTMCMGVVSYPNDGVSEETLMQRADYALYKAKQSGKNEVTRYSRMNSETSSKRLDMERCMRDAVASGCKEFEVYYQPLVDITKQQHVCCGAEALVRWNSPELGFLSPAEFVTLAEYLGLITPIGEHVLMEACKRCKYWNDFGHPEYRVNVNLSIVQLMQKNIVDTVRNTLVYTGMNPRNLTLEVTESLAVNDMEAVTKVLDQLHELGVRLALDDFGTGYSSLAYLREMPLDVLKIDKCFVDDVGESTFSEAFVKTVSELAEAINVNVIVEGVEDRKQEEVLGHMKVDMIQGYLYDKPLSQEDFEAKYLD